MGGGGPEFRWSWSSKLSESEDDVERIEGRCFIEGEDLGIGMEIDCTDFVLDKVAGAGLASLSRMAAEATLCENLSLSTALTESSAAFSRTCGAQVIDLDVTSWLAANCSLSPSQGGSVPPQGRRSCKQAWRSGRG